MIGYKTFPFNTFNITPIENIENDKYSIKNNTTYDKEVFFAAANQSRAINNSMINFTVIAIKVCMVCSSAFLPVPRKNITSVTMEDTIKAAVRIRRSGISVIG